MQGNCFFNVFFREGFVNFVVVNSGNLKERQLLQFSAVFLNGIRIFRYILNVFRKACGNTFLKFKSCLGFIRILI